jgi:hypothetical protein
VFLEEEGFFEEFDGIIKCFSALVMFQRFKSCNVMFTLKEMTSLMDVVGIVLSILKIFSFIEEGGFFDRNSAIWPLWYFRDANLCNVLFVGEGIFDGERSIMERFFAQNNEIIKCFDVTKTLTSWL